MSDLPFRANGTPLPNTPTAPTNVTNGPSVHKKYAKFIWPVGVIVALVLGFFGGQQSRQSCADAVSKIDGAMLASDMHAQSPASDIANGWAKASSTLLDEYNADADKCLN